MVVERTIPDRTRDPEDPRPSTYINKVTHWWDGSAIYGASQAQNSDLRTGEDGKMILIDGRLPLEKDKLLSGIDQTGFNDNYWAGLALLHTLFVKEHNAICDMLKKSYPSWDDEKLFLTARLVNAALMAKIHTIEWTPGILNTPVLQTGMHSNWYGALPQWAKATRMITKAIDIEAGAGIIGSELKHHGASFAITEEFISVYRLHPLIPDDYAIHDHRTGKLIENVEFNTLMGNDTRASVDKFGWSDLMYHFGTEHPGQITLHNHPRALMDHTRVTGQHLDLGTIDMFRDRERGVRRYNDFRHQLRMPQGQVLRQAHPEPRLERRDRGALRRQDRRRRPAGRAARRKAASGLRIQRHRVPDLHPDGQPAAEERPVLYPRLHPRGLHPRGTGLDRPTTPWVTSSSATTPELAPALEGNKNAFAPWKKTR